MSAFPTDTDLARVFESIFAPKAPTAEPLFRPRVRDPKAVRLEAMGRAMGAHGEYLVAQGEAMQAEAEAMEADDEDRAWYAERATKRARDAHAAHDAWVAAKKACALLFPASDDGA